MARLASIEKAGFYPTPPRVADMIALMVRPSIGAVVLDPCCGEGDALAALGKAWNATTLGNELSKERAAKAAEQCDAVTHGPIEFLQVEDQASALFLNPPYDTDDSGARLELRFLQIATPWLVPGGWLFYIVPDHVAALKDVADLLVRWYDSLGVYRFPEPEYQNFKQVLVVGNKRSRSNVYRYGLKQEFLTLLESSSCPALPVAQPPITLPPVAATPKLAVSVPDAAETLALSSEHGPTTASLWENLTSPRGIIGNFRPVNKPMPGHAAMLVMDGKVDGTEVLSDEGERLLLRGTSVKIIKVDETSERSGDKIRHKREERERIATVIQALNLDTGKLEEHSSQDAERFEEFLKTHQDKLIGAVDMLYPPLFVPGRDMPRWLDKLRHIHGPRPLPGNLLNGLLPKQAESSAALATLLEQQKAGLLIGECGVGKTCMAIALQGLIGSGDFKIVVMAPAQVCAKWARESEAVLKEFNLQSHIVGKKRKQAHSVPLQEGWAYTNGTNKDTGLPNAVKQATDGRIIPARERCAQEKQIGKPILDVVRAMEEPNPSLLVMSYEIAKNGAPWEAAFNIRKRRVSWTATKTEGLHHYPYTREIEVECSELMGVACCPNCGATLREEDGAPWPTDRRSNWWRKKQRLCPECEGVLFQSLSFKYGGRFAAATFLSKQYAGRFKLIIDEAHNTKARDTDIAQASMNLISAANKVAGLTGTIYDGKASGVFAILYRLLPEFRQLYGWQDRKRFIDHHGLWKKTFTKTTKVGDRHTSSWGYGRENARVDEMPGVTPGIISWILRMSIFIRKRHVADSLPAYTEYRVPVETTKSQAEVLKDLARAHNAARAKCRKGQMSLMSQCLYALCGALDYNEPDMIGDEEDSFGIGGATVEPGELLPKDRAVLDIVKQELAADRGVGIYFSQVNRRDWIPRFKQILKDNGIRSTVLRANTCKKAAREAWFRDAVEWFKSIGQPVVLLANGNLVKEGLDLIECPTLIETGIDFRLINVLQRDQRAHRIVQPKDCKVYFVYYKGTFQEQALSLVAAKARAARTMEGKLIAGLAQLGAEEDLMSALIKAAQTEEKPTVMDWGDMKIEDISKPMPIPKLASKPEPSSTSKRKRALFQAEDYQQLGLGL